MANSSCVGENAEMGHRLVFCFCLLKDVQETVNSVYLCKLTALHISGIISNNNDNVIS